MTTNAVKCPKCGHENSNADNFCLNCGNSILNMQLPPQYAPLEPQQQQQNKSFQSYQFNVPENFKAAQPQSELGAKVFLWYKIFNFFFGASFLIWLILGALAILGSTEQPTSKEQTDAFLGGIMFSIYALVGSVPFLISLFLPARPFHWVYGIILLIISMISCVGIPFAAPLLYFWLKPETQAYFGRRTAAAAGYVSPPAPPKF